VALSSVGCRKATDATESSADAASQAITSDLHDVLRAIALAEDARKTRDIAPEVTSSRDVRVRRRASMALARIADDAARERLVALVSDDDAVVGAWAAYGLGQACRDREDKALGILAARLAVVAARLRQKPGEPNTLPQLLALMRAMARCDADGAEATLRTVLTSKEKSDVDSIRAAAIALGDLAVKRKQLNVETLLGLLDAQEFQHVDEVFYALSRVDLPESQRVRTAERARVAAGTVGEYRIFAIKVLAKNHVDASAELDTLVRDKSLGISERVEAARGLGLHELGRELAAKSLSEIMPSNDPMTVLALGGETFALVTQLVSSTGVDPSKKAEGSLYAMANLTAPDPPPTLARRLESLRCLAAEHLSKGGYDTDVMKKCAPAGSYAFELARLHSLGMRPMSGERRAAWLALTQSQHVRVREGALDLIGAHPELAEAARSALADALSSGRPGLVASAAEAIHAHPERVLTVSERERRAALDPRAPPPSTNPEETLDPRVQKALRAALAASYSRDLFETRLGLLDAAVATAMPEARDAAHAACKDANVTVRERGAKALRALGEMNAQCTKQGSASEGESSEPPAPEIDALVSTAKAPRLVFSTSAGELSMTLDPDVAPITSARLVNLAKAGFFKGIVVHRVVPAFVVQFGDPFGDGYGGSGTPLRCETSPQPFMSLDVGMALAGRDTGSSQLFVTLSRTPHLDGAYTRVGHATGPWFDVTEGDVIQDVNVIE
jgi:cyclophilin family peptidyl-prolyl cis-trans isomerase